MTTSVVDPLVETQPRRRLFSVDEYYAMAEAGILAMNERVELIDGEIITMSPIGNEHEATVRNRELPLGSLRSRPSCPQSPGPSAPRPPLPARTRPDASEVA